MSRRMDGRRHRIHRRGDVVEKEHGSRVDLDWTRAKQMHVACEKIDGLAAPEPLEMNLSDGVIVYRHVTGLTPFLECRKDASRAALAGRLLAQLHESTISLEQEDLRLSREWLTSIGVSQPDVEQIAHYSRPGFLHGDCWHGNLFWTKEGTLLILDPVAELRAFNHAPSIAHGQADIAMLHMSLFLCHPLIPTIAQDLHARYQPLAEALVDGYASARGLGSSGKCILRIGQLLAFDYIASYKHRLVPPLARIKERLGYRNAVQAYKECSDD